MRESDLVRAWQPRASEPIPDRNDPAGQLWWAARDRLASIASAAAAIKFEAQAAFLRLRDGQDPQLEALDESLNRWGWTGNGLDFVHTYRSAIERSAGKNLVRPTSRPSPRIADRDAADGRGLDLAL